MISDSIPLVIQYVEVKRLADNKASPHNRTSKERICMVGTSKIHDIDNEDDVL